MALGAWNLSRPSFKVLLWHVILAYSECVDEEMFSVLLWSMCAVQGRGVAYQTTRLPICLFFNSKDTHFSIALQDVSKEKTSFLGAPC